MLNPPTPFLSVVVHRLDPLPGLVALCAGYELEEWRCNQLAEHMMRWLPEFCLNWNEAQSLDTGNCVELISKAARRVYQTEKFKNRGEFGELLLHIVLRQVFGTLPAISKIYYKDSSNDTVKGFDAVHVVATGDDLELWLGEAKFHEDINAAIRSVVGELEKHTERDYLRNEFVAIKNKIDDEWPHADKLKDLLHGNTSLDVVFSSACIPVLLTYDSSTVAKHKVDSDEYRREIEEEVLKHYASFIASGLKLKVKLHLFLLPLNTKQKLIRQLDEKLKIWQQI
jgi:hypothetical protein